MDIATEDLDDLVTSDLLSVGNPNTLHTVGECVTTVSYGDSCHLEPEFFTWYLNGSKINNTNFTLDTSGRLTFTNAQNSNVGLYLCVITLPGGFGSYITAAKELKLSTTRSQGNAYIDSNNLSVCHCRTDPVDSSENNNTPAWAITLIVAVSVIVAGLLIVIGVFMQVKVGFWCCFVDRRKTITRSSTGTSLAKMIHKTEYFKQESSSDSLLKEPTEKSRKSSKASHSFKRTSLIRGSQV